jgi:hypothetical protein
MILSRRSFLVGLLAAPIIVREGLIMPVKPLAMERGIVVGYDFKKPDMVLASRSFMDMFNAELAKLRRGGSIEFRIPGFDRHGNPVAKHPLG